MGILEGEVDLLGVETYFCDDLTSIRATRGGYSDILVELNDDVTEGQVAAIQFNAFGDIQANYTAPWDGRVLSIGTDPIREPGALMFRICRQLGPALPTDPPAPPTTNPPSPPATDPPVAEPTDPPAETDPPSGGGRRLSSGSFYVKSTISLIGIALATYLAA